MIKPKTARGMNTPPTPPLAITVEVATSLIAKSMPSIGNASSGFNTHRRTCPSAVGPIDSGAPNSTSLNSTNPAAIRLPAVAITHHGCDLWSCFAPLIARLKTIAASPHKAPTIAAPNSSRCPNPTRTRSVGTSNGRSSSKPLTSTKVT